MKCNFGTGIVCTSYESCEKALGCPNVLQGINAKLTAKKRKEIKEQRKKEIKKELLKLAR